MSKFVDCFPVSLVFLLNIPIEYSFWIFSLNISFEYFFNISFEYFFWIFSLNISIGYFYGIYLIEYQVREWAKSLFIFLSPSAQTTLHLPSLKPTLHDKKKPHWKNFFYIICFAGQQGAKLFLWDFDFSCKYSS